MATPHWHVVRRSTVKLAVCGGSESEGEGGLEEGVASGRCGAGLGRQHTWMARPLLLGLGVMSKSRKIGRDKGGFKQSDNQSARIFCIDETQAILDGG